MAAVDVARALMQLDADGTWELVANGDDSALGNLALTDEETELVRRAAVGETDSEEVTGFDAVIQERPNPMSKAVAYCYASSLPPGVGQTFGGWASARGIIIDNS
jgi:hypothetical protein